MSLHKMFFVCMVYNNSIICFCSDELEAKSEPAAVVRDARVAPPESAATVAANKPANKESVIQKIGQTALAVPSAISSSKVLATKDLYESGHDIPNAELCPEFGAGLKLLILITSAPSHIDARNAIRYKVNLVNKEELQF
jgi:hypothetical protein